MINSRVNSLNLTSKSLPLDDKELKSITLPLTSPARPMQYENTKHHQQQQQPSPKLIQTLGPINLLSPTNIQLPNISPSSFEITLQSTSQSPFHSSIISPHYPPYEADLYYPLRNPRQQQHSQQQRQTLLQRPQRQRQSSLTSGFNRRDAFYEFAEDRYNRFRPLDSQHNNNAILSGLHPFQQDNYGLPKKTFLQSVSNWFKLKKPESQIIENNGLIQNSSNKSTDTNTNTNTNTIETGTGIGTGTTISGSGGDDGGEVSINQNEPYDTTPQPIYTPRGIPINEFQLNFNNKENQDSIVRRNDEIINSFDDEVRDLINGADNFLTSCFQGCWDIGKIVSDSFVELC